MPQEPTTLSHVSPSGTARMVDVGDKPITARTAIAEGFVRVAPELLALIRAGNTAKGPVLETARLAAIQAAKRTDELIPLCHTLPLDSVDIAFEVLNDRIRIAATVRTHARTGVEMEALAAVAVAGLTIIDMGKAVDKQMSIEGIRVIEKHGGRSGSWQLRGDGGGAGRSTDPRSGRLAAGQTDGQ